MYNEDKNILEEFYSALKLRDTDSIKNALYSSFLIDRSAKTAKIMCREIESKGLNNSVYVVSDDRNLLLDENFWTKDYLKQLLNDLRYNFSKERIDLLIKVSQKVYPVYEETVEDVYKNTKITNGQENEHIRDTIEKIMLIIKFVVKGKSERLGDFCIKIGEKLVEIGNDIKNRK